MTNINLPIKLEIELTKILEENEKEIIEDQKPYHKKPSFVDIIKFLFHKFKIQTKIMRKFLEEIEKIEVKDEENQQKMICLVQNAKKIIEDDNILSSKL